MSRHADPDEILARNPQVDPDRLEQTRKVLRELRAMGMPRKGYDLALPYGGRRAIPQDDARIAPRLVRLAGATDTK